MPDGGITASGINNASSVWSGSVYWAGAGQNLPTELNAGGAWSGFVSRYFGFQLICDANPCGKNKGASLQITGNVNLSVRETTGPTLSAPDGLWQSKGWIRGQWPLNFSGTAPSGMCALNGTIDGLPIPQTTSSPRDVAAWKQCAAPPVRTTINTASYEQGAVPLHISGYDAAGRTASITRTLDIDNSTPALTMSGPSDAPTTAGTQYVTATAGGSPSGIEGIVCEINGGTAHWYPGARARVAVSGVGEHQVGCQALNNAATASGAHAASPPRYWSTKIGQPTELGVAFVRYVGLKCHRRKHGTVICHPRTTRKRVVVRVPVRHHGRIVRHHGRVVYRRKVEHRRVVVQPHWSAGTARHVRFGHATTVSGWLGLTGGTALANRTVQILTAPDNGLDHFTVATSATTSSNGTWTVTLPAGPSRLVRAVYAGGPTTEATGSGEVKEIVSSRIKLTSISPTHVAWGRTITIKGKLSGGHLPAGGVNVRMRIGIGDAKATYGVHEHVRGRGRLSTTYTFGAGAARIHRRYWFQIATLPSGNYPYSPSSSNRIVVHVGGHPRHR